MCMTKPLFTNNTYYSDTTMTWSTCNHNPWPLGVEVPLTGTSSAASHVLTHKVGAEGQGSSHLRNRKRWMWENSEETVTRHVENMDNTCLNIVKKNGSRYMGETCEDFAKKHLQIVQKRLCITCNFWQHFWCVLQLLHSFWHWWI